jgi:hypothetical protein
MKPAFLMIVPGGPATSLGIVLTIGQSIVHGAQLRSSGHVRG